jgi:deoxyribonuclease-1
LGPSLAFAIGQAQERDMKDHRIAVGRVFLVAALLALLPTISTLADQTQIRNYRTARVLFWGRVYSEGGFTFYCGEPFEDKTDLNVEHIYPASWMAAFLGCGSRKECRKTNERFNHMEADLHNLFPVRADIKQARPDFRFGIIQGEEREFGECNFERNKDSHILEPRLVSLPIDHRDVELLKEWNRADPPTDHEMRRNNVIEELQGTRNRFIDHPKWVEDFEVLKLQRKTPEERLERTLGEGVAAAPARGQIMNPTIGFYVVLVLWTLFNVFSPRTLAYVAPQKRATYLVVDKPTWIVTALLLALTPLWWGWVTTSYVGAVLVPVVGLILVGGLVLNVLEDIVTFPSVTGLEMMTRVMTYATPVLIVIGLVWLIRYIMN